MANAAAWCLPLSRHRPQILNMAETSQSLFTKATFDGSTHYAAVGLLGAEGGPAPAARRSGRTR